MPGKRRESEEIVLTLPQAVAQAVGPVVRGYTPVTASSLRASASPFTSLHACSRTALTPVCELSRTLVNRRRRIYMPETP